MKRRREEKDPIAPAAEVADAVNPVGSHPFCCGAISTRIYGVKS